jgi:hypothetical protein
MLSQLLTTRPDGPVQNIRGQTTILMLLSGFFWSSADSQMFSA